MPTGYYKLTGLPYKGHNKSGYKMPESMKTKLRKLVGKKASAWKGDKVSKMGIHMWVKSILGCPLICSHCKSRDKKAYDWSNKDHLYKRNIKDYQRLCRSCHRKYDYKNHLSNIGSRWGSIKNKLTASSPITRKLK